MIRSITIAGTLALALVATVGCDRTRRDDASTTNTTSGTTATRDLDNNGRNDTRLDDKGYLSNGMRDETLALKDAGRTSVTTTTGAITDRTDTQSAEAKREIAEDKADLMTKRADYKAKVTEDLADADKRIAKLEEKMSTTKDAAERARLQRSIASIKTKRAEFTRSMTSIDTATDTTWSTVKVNVNHAWGDLKQAVDDAR
jgi:chromosome segregation ATPase